LRRWSHEEDNEVLPRSARARRAHGEHGSQWAAIESIAGKIGCSVQTLSNWVRQYERDTGQRDGIGTAEAVRIKELECAVRELKKANEILRLASAYFAQAELHRRNK
jgi:transposase-like protein